MESLWSHETQKTRDIFVSVTIMGKGRTERRPGDVSDQLMFGDHTNINTSALGMTGMSPLLTHVAMDDVPSMNKQDEAAADRARWRWVAIRRNLGRLIAKSRQGAVTSSGEKIAISDRAGRTADIARVVLLSVLFMCAFGVTAYQWSSWYGSSRETIYDLSDRVRTIMLA